MSNLSKPVEKAVINTVSGAITSGMTTGAVATGTVAIGTGTGVTVGGTSTIVAIAVGEASAATGTLAFAAGPGAVASGTILGIAGGAISTAALPALGTIAVIGGVGYGVSIGVNRLWNHFKDRP